MLGKTAKVPGGMLTLRKHVPLRGEPAIVGPVIPAGPDLGRYNRPYIVISDFVVEWR